eukprot:5810075-Prorocentrum_lima.AAC.1
MATPEDAVAVAPAPTEDLPKEVPAVSETTAEETEESSVLTEGQIDTIKSVWEQVEALGPETVGVILFKHIFALAPEAVS